MTPENPVVGGTTLRIPAIQSPNFVAGVSGWQVAQDGSAQFNGLDITGGSITFDAASGAFLVYSGTPALGNLVLAISAVAGTDQFGNAYPAVLELKQAVTLNPNGVFVYA